MTGFNEDGNMHPFSRESFLDCLCLLTGRTVFKVFLFSPVPKEHSRRKKVFTRQFPAMTLSKSGAGLPINSAWGCGQHSCHRCQSASSAMAIWSELSTHDSVDALFSIWIGISCLAASHMRSWQVMGCATFIWAVIKLKLKFYRVWFLALLQMNCISLCGTNISNATMKKKGDFACGFQLETTFNIDSNPELQRSNHDMTERHDQQHILVFVQWTSVLETVASWYWLIF